MPPARDRLPRETPVPATRGRLLLALAVALTVVALLNLAAGLALERFTTNRGYWIVRHKWDLLEALPAPVDWLILGDSSCNQGIMPDLIGQQLGGRAVNVCTLGNMLAVNDAWMLARHIERLGPPKHVLIVHVYDVWHRDPRALVDQPLLAKVPLPWGFWRSATPPLALTGAQERKLWVARYLPLWAENKTLARWLRHPTAPGQHEFLLTADGFMAHARANPANVRRENRSHLESIRKRRFTLSQINHQSLVQIRALADQHGFDVYLAPAPLSEGIWRDPDFRRHFAAMTLALETIASESPRMHVLLREPITFPAHQLENADHLVGPAARVYTQQLIRALQSLQTARK